MVGAVTEVAMGKDERRVVRKNTREQGNSSEEQPSSCENHGSTSGMLWKCGMWAPWQYRKCEKKCWKYQKLGGKLQAYLCSQAAEADL